MKGSGWLSGGRTGATVGAGLPGVVKGSQIGLHGLEGELSGFSGGLTVASEPGYAGRADRGPP